MLLDDTPLPAQPDESPASPVSVCISRNEIGYFAYSPAFSGCHGIGDTRQEALEAFRQSLEVFSQTLPEGEAEALMLRPLTVLGPCEA